MVADTVWISLLSLLMSHFTKDAEGHCVTTKQGEANKSVVSSEKVL